MLNIFAIALFQFASLTSSASSESVALQAPIVTTTGITTDGGSGGWGGDITTDGGSGGWGGDITTDGGSGGWGGDITTDGGSGGWGGDITGGGN
ncbi:hypothetical protein [Hymenobacter rubidus]|uniref:hypothetical protein n=1 Tax=Hymenobacter rubidus TaxID=1441626 RepID=UPI00191D6EDF|nr:hypothetical protein [Hymenobacter rubidus]